jgi:hypothetical protein
MSLTGSERVRGYSALEHMARRGVLTVRQYEAGQRLASSYSLGVVGLRGQDTATARTPPVFMEARIGAAQDYETARDILGGRLWPVVWAVACGDQTVQEVAAERHQNATATMTLLRLALDLLGDHYSLPDGA